MSDHHEVAATNIQKVYRGHRARRSHRRRVAESKKEHFAQADAEALPGQPDRSPRHSAHRPSHKKSPRRSHDNTHNEKEQHHQHEQDGEHSSDWSDENEHELEMEAPEYMHAPTREDTGVELKEELSLEKAERHRHLTCPHEKLKDGKYRKWPLCTSIEKTRQYGLGTYMYFKMMRRLIAVFVLLTIMAIPAMYFPSQNEVEILDVNLGFEPTMLGNLGYDPTGTILIEGWTKKEIGGLLAGMDVFYTVLFLAFIWFASRLRVNADAVYRKRVLTVDTYTVAVRGLPWDAMDRIEIGLFFERLFGAVVDVAIVYDDYDLLERYQERGKMKLELARLKRLKMKKEAKAYKEKITHFTEQLKKDETKRIGELKNLGAYVTFLSQNSAALCLKAYPLSSNVCLRYCLPNRLRYRNHILQVDPAPEPSNILYENLKYNKKQTTWRRRLTLLVTVVLVALSAAVTLTSTFFNKQVVEEDVVCDDTLNFYTINKAIADDDTDPSNLDRECYCQSLGAKIYTQSTLCNSFLSAYLTRQGLIIFSAVMVVVVNFALRLSMKRISEYEKHKTVTHTQTAILNKLFYSYFINTAMITLIMNANFGGNFDWLNLGFVFNGQYTDFTEDWYNFVGVGVVLSMFLNMFNPGLITFVWVFIMRCKRSTRADNCKTQSELNKLYGGFHFELASRYAAMLNTVFVTLLYSPGMPVLLPIAVGAFTLNYWFDKHAFFNLYAIPPRYDSSVERDFLKMLPKAVFLHCAFAVWFYTSPVTHWGSEERAAEPTESFSLGKRMFAPPAVAHTVILFVMVGYWVLSTFLSHTLGKLCGMCCGEHEAQAYKNFPTYWEAKKMTILESYHLSQQPSHQLAFIRTASGLQLPPTAEIVDNPFKNETKKTDNAFMRRKHHQTLVDFDASDKPKHAGFGFPGQAPRPVHDGHHPIQVQCGDCHQPFSIVDVGHPMTYMCPHCHHQVVV